MSPEEWFKWNSNTQHINALAAQSAAAAKTITLPVLQANQDPFGLLTANISSITCVDYRIYSVCVCVGFPS